MRKIVIGSIVGAIVVIVAVVLGLVFGLKSDEALCAADPTAVEADGFSQLGRAAKSGDFETVMECFPKKPEGLEKIETRDKSGNNLYNYAWPGSLAVVTKIFKALDVKSDFGAVDGNNEKTCMK